jgi:hypothetical protein
MHHSQPNMGARTVPRDPPCRLLSNHVWLVIATLPTIGFHVVAVVRRAPAMDVLLTGMGSSGYWKWPAQPTQETCEVGFEILGEFLGRAWT